ncbi:Metallophosphoesterase [Acanthamoeba castellanii str. Neff]|uniref:Metallophosphoesterase n=1 Tax=Acanthamoeba castellanii (strain ATCC 30010 / Neff) TaxID=1257118 RepID=L8HCK0_ACACF|nr:Metallophosphoesterase [Acanthamoeba castellanii str. Neff]ELR23269.1 Metallophosphoesterase [Acanthamoeba castellanii str. Neff]
MVDIPLFDGPSFREIVLIVGFVVGIAITLALTLTTLIGCCVWRCCVCCQRRRRKKEVLQQRVLDASGGPPSGGASEQRVYHPVGADMRARALLDIEEEERGQKVSRVTWVLVYVVVWTWLFFLGAGPLFWLVVMDYLPWWAGWLCATALLWLGWFFFFPLYGTTAAGHHDVVRLDRRSSLRDSGYVLVEDDDGYGDTRMLSINPATAQRADFHGTNGTGGGGGDGDHRTTRRGSRNPIKLTGRLLRERVRRVRRRPFVFVGGLLFWLVLIFSLTFVFEGMCIGEYPISIDFRLVRQLQSSTCSGDAPCHVYLTFPPGNMSSSIIVHFHASDLAPSCASTVYYDTQSRKNGTLADYRFNTTGTHFKYETKDFTRYIHWVRIDTLEPDTVYFFRAGCGAHPQLFSPEKRFLSAPGPDANNFTFITGGDMGTSDETRTIEITAAQLDPRFAILGGDLAYANALPTCYRVWDKWFDMWEENMITRDGNVIPLVAIVGNHETGGGSSLHQSVSDIPFFFRYFHMYPGDEAVKQEQRQRKEEAQIRVSAAEQASIEASSTSGDLLPVIEADQQQRLQQRPALSDADLQRLPNVYLTDAWDTTYHHHFLGDHLFLTLDSGMFLDVQGDQTAWLRERLDSWNATRNQSVDVRQGHIMAIYHGVDVWQNDMRKFWEPLFDAYHVAVGFENHSHRYGRAHTLKAGKVDPTGTLYLGGGSFGVPPSANNGNPWYMVNVYQKRHFLHVNVTPYEIFIDVIDEHGDIFDRVSAR